MRWPRWLGGMVAIAIPGVGVGGESCALEFRIPLALSPSTTAQLVGGLASGLRIEEGVRGRPLWSGGATRSTTQRFPEMTAGFAASLAAVDTNGDGAQDRIYAGDLQGRLWRFDLDFSAPPSQWVTGGVFADLGGGIAGRGFLAAPDITLVAPGDAPPWLSIAIGTANTFPALAAVPMAIVSHRFYVLRDRAPFERWTQSRYDQWSPLSESDLALAEGQRLQVARAAGAGFYVNVGADQVLAPALTLNGDTRFTVAHTRASFLPECLVFPATPPAVTVSVSSISALDGSPANDRDIQLDQPVAANSAIALVRAEDSNAVVTCEVAGHALPGCSLDTTLHRSFWRREDAD